MKRQHAVMFRFWQRLTSSVLLRTARTAKLCTCCPWNAELLRKQTRDALDEGDYKNIPVFAGCSAESVKETVVFCTDAKANGADYGLVLPPSYYKSLLMKKKGLIVDWFREVAGLSPLPIVIYNFPPAAGGIDLSSDEIIELAEHPNIAGCKLTCSNTGKLTRITAKTDEKTFKCMGGSVDITAQTAECHGFGIIGGTANLLPKSCVLLWHYATRKSQLSDNQREGI